jgi:hypothetical protein
MRQSAGGAAALFIGICLLGGCSNLRLHDETRARLAAETKDQYAKADVPGILDVEAKNLDLLLAESIKVSRENHKLQLDFALLSIAADQTPMADTWFQALEHLKSIGFDATSDTKSLRAFLKANSTAEVRDRQLATFADFIKQDTGHLPPECPADTLLPTVTEWAKQWNIPDVHRDTTTPLYAEYESACKQLQEARRRGLPEKGSLADVAARLKDQLEERQAKTKEIAQQTGKLKDARAAYQAAVDAATASTARCADGEKAISKTAQDAFKAAQKAADKVDLSVANEERIRQLLVLLEAAAGGGPEPASVNAAARVAREFPSLWHDMCELQAIGKAPSVGNLLLALRHATLLVDYAQQQRALADARIDFLVRKQALLRQEAEQWLRFLDAFCSYAVLAADGKSPGANCSSFKVSTDGATCTLSGQTLKAPCAARNSWGTNLGTRGKKAATRELDKALLAYQRGFALRAEASDVDFRIIDVHHRETLARKQFAVRDWDALVGGGVGQLDAYFAAGIKPAEIADLFVKAIGFIAIAIGIAQ